MVPAARPGQQEPVSEPPGTAPARTPQAQLQLGPPGQPLSEAPGTQQPAWRGAMDAAGLGRRDRTAVCQLHGLGNSSCHPCLPRHPWLGPQWVFIFFLLRSHAFSPHAGVQGPQGVNEHPLTACTICCALRGTHACAPAEDRICTKLGVSYKNPI